MSPGHALEIGWFLLDEARVRGQDRFVEAALTLIEWGLEKGWDTEFGGVFVFTDLAGTPVDPWGHRKVWWPQAEALCAVLFVYRSTRMPVWEEWFDRIHTYVFDHFRDGRHGEWFGYLTREGVPIPGFSFGANEPRPSGSAKGDRQKSAFHVLRSLLACWTLLRESGAGDVPAVARPLR